MIVTDEMVDAALVAFFDGDERWFDAAAIEEDGWVEGLQRDMRAALEAAIALMPDDASALAEARAALHEARMQAIADDARVEMVCEDLAEARAEVETVREQAERLLGELSWAQESCDAWCKDYSELQGVNAELRAEIERLKTQVIAGVNAASVLFKSYAEKDAQNTEMRALVQAGLEAVNVAYAQAQAEYQGRDRAADKHDKVVMEWRQKARAALAQFSAGEVE